MFFGKDAGIRTGEAPRNMLVAMGMLAALCILIGLAPGILYSLLPFETEYVPYTAFHVVSTLGLLGFTALGFFLLLKLLNPTPTISLDTDWFYRKGAKAFVRLVARPVTWIDENVVGQAYEWIVRGPGAGCRAALPKGRYPRRRRNCSRVGFRDPRVERCDQGSFKVDRSTTTPSSWPLERSP